MNKVEKFIIFGTVIVMIVPWTIKGIILAFTKKGKDDEQDESK